MRSCEGWNDVEGGSALRELSAALLMRPAELFVHVFKQHGRLIVGRVVGAVDERYRAAGCKLLQPPHDLLVASSSAR
jgi:hypothetical protein